MTVKKGARKRETPQAPAKSQTVYPSSQLPIDLQYAVVLTNLERKDNQERRQENRRGKKKHSFKIDLDHKVSLSFCL